MPKTTPTAPDLSEATADYLAEITRIRRQGETREHTYRSALETLLNAHLRGRMSECQVVHEPEMRQYGAPDFAVKKGGVAVGFVETKRIGENLNTAEQSGQIVRYRAALPNLILSDYLEFRLYAEGSPGPVAVANLRETPNGADELAALLKGFADAGESGPGESPDASRLAKIMAGKTRLLRDLVEKAAAVPKSELAEVHEGLRKNLIRDLKLPDFADIFAQTAAYGFFAARLESERRGAPKFSRIQTGDLLPQTTPFLRRFFNAFAGADMDPRISWMADDIAAMFSAVSLDNVVRAFNQGGLAEDPFLHFYETFLREYDSAKRQARGVYFTPRPVVDFIVRAVDHSLVKDFGIRDGLASTSAAKFGGRKKHRVQILDPAAGTGAFLSRVTELIRDRVQKNAGEGGWKRYVPEHLLPRLHGFEILMSAYAMCHLKMALTLGDNIGGIFSKARGERDYRVNVFLASALDAPKTDAKDFPLLTWLRDESQAADRIKTETPVMVVLGNPPYNVSSQNRGEWIAEKLEEYKRGLDEKKLNLDDDYIKFIRCAEHFVERNGRGVVAMITNNSFLDGVTHRQMRKHLLETFDTIRILNLHGDATKRERAPDGGPDQNVFNIRQGVGVFVMTKTGKKKKGENARVFHAKLQGGRKMKYEFLARKSIGDVEWRELRPAAPYCFFTPKTFSAARKYMSGVGVRDLFRQNGSGLKTDRDSLFLDMDRNPLVERMRTLLGGQFDDRFAEFYQVKDSSGYKMLNKIRAAGKFDAGRVIPTQFRPFDERLVYYDPDLLSRPNRDTMDHLKGGENVALLTTRLIPANHGFTHAHVSRRIAGSNAVGGWTYVFPLWVWEKGAGKKMGQLVRRANFCEDAAKAFAKRMGMTYSEGGKGSKADIVAPEALFDYIYAILHRPSYRSRFAEFLRIDYPRIPPAADKGEFRRMSGLGRKLRELHLLESPLLEKAGFPFSGKGGEEVDRAVFAEDANGVRGRVFINAKRHFANVPLAAWEYCIGGDYPAQKWLKDRRGRTLSYDEQEHYRRMLAALARSAALVKKLDEE